MELIFVVATALIVWLYFVNAALCYLVVGGGVSGIVMAVILSKILKARKLRVRIESKVGAFRHGAKDLIISQDPL